MVFGMIHCLGCNFPSSTLSILTYIQAEISGQDQGGYDVEPNFFHGMHQVRATQDPCFLSHIICYSMLKREPLVQLLHLYRTPPHRQSAPLPPLKLTYGTYSPGRPITQHHPSSTFLFAKGKERNAAAGAPGKDPNIISDEDYEYLNTQ
ncbi:hypothetical protein CY34DRAFT_689125 [Suillus luteus UH-Slu-Lm8-n1]|uniref:Uncharacterized protein n=1 Tax=Suillus luteus UH-Slu-Lm8-n1 TaxID=930992 RepID=A0A0C9Z838_9AGAM|nr:hypothetical protein CY34DRAFT_689125 [Suillus luteus UH-Slu-Lm8-n1]